MTTISYHAMMAFSNENKEQDPLLLRNVEALTKDPEIQRPCDNKNGYRQWSSKGFLRSEKNFYDCCYQKLTGYNPQHDCKD